MTSPRTLYIEWIQSLDQATLAALQSVQAWGLTWAFTSLIVALVHLVPGVAELTGLELRVAWGLMTAATIVGSWNAWRFERGAPLSRVAGVMLLEEALLFLHAIAGLAHSTGFGQTAMGFVLLMIASYQGNHLRVSWRHPFGALGALAGIGLGVAFWPGARDMVNLVMTYPLALFLLFFSGGWAERAARWREQNQRYREALLAQQLLDATTRNEQLRHTLTDVLGLRHDLNNLFQIVDATSSLLAVSELDDDQHMLLKDMGEAHDNIKDLLEGMTAVEQGVRGGEMKGELQEFGELEDVALAPVLERVAARQRALGKSQIHVEIVEAGTIEIRGGEVALARVVENLVKNAREGDGDRRAAHIWVRCRVGRDGGTAQVIVEDDGPGFDAEMLQQGYELFGTTKEEGTGLGLYIIDRIITAHHGRMHLEARPGGGARVVLVWPRRQETKPTGAQI